MTLSLVELRYSQIEREGLAIMFGCLTFEMYLLGRQLVFTDPRKFGPARVERIRLRLQGFDCIIIYRPGETNPSDYRHL